LAVEIEGGALGGGVCPWVVMVQHVDKHDAEGPDICATRTISRCNVVATFYKRLQSDQRSGMPCVYSDRSSIAQKKEEKHVP